MKTNIDVLKDSDPQDRLFLDKVLDEKPILSRLPRQNPYKPQTNINERCIGKKDLAVILTFPIIGFSLISILYFHNEVSLKDKFIPEHVRLFSLYDSTAQTKAHLMLLCLTAISCLVGFFYEHIETLFPRLPINNALCKKLLKMLHRYSGLLIIPFCMFFVFKKYSPFTAMISLRR